MCVVQVLGSNSPDAPWLQAITERVMTVYCDRLSGYAWCSPVSHRPPRFALYPNCVSRAHHIFRYCLVPKLRNREHQHHGLSVPMKDPSCSKLHSVILPS